MIYIKKKRFFELPRKRKCSMKHLEGIKMEAVNTRLNLAFSERLSFLDKLCFAERLEKKCRIWDPSDTKSKFNTAITAHS